MPTEGVSEGVVVWVVGVPIVSLHVSRPQGGPVTVSVTIDMNININIALLIIRIIVYTRYSIPIT